MCVALIYSICSSSVEYCFTAAFTTFGTEKKVSSYIEECSLLDGKGNRVFCFVEGEHDGNVEQSTNDVFEAPLILNKSPRERYGYLN